MQHTVSFKTKSPIVLEFGFNYCNLFGLLPSYSYLESAQALEQEGGASITKYEVCDNVDLPTILQVSCGGIEYAL